MHSHSIYDTSFSRFHGTLACEMHWISLCRDDIFHVFMLVMPKTILTGLLLKCTCFIFMLQVYNCRILRDTAHFCGSCIYGAGFVIIIHCQIYNIPPSLSIRSCMITWWMVGFWLFLMRLAKSTTMGIRLEDDHYAPYTQGPICYLHLIICNIIY